MIETRESKFCPFADGRYACSEECALWSLDHEACAFLLMGEGIKDLSYATDDINFDCGLRVHVTKEEKVSPDD